MPRIIFIFLILLYHQAGAQGHKMEIHGHRGFRGQFPENTITAFKEAAKLGVDYIELDVIISKDSQVVVSHEPWFNPVTCSEPSGKPVRKNARRNLYKMTYAEIRKYDCGRRGNKNFPQQARIPEYKPLLSEVIDSIENFTKANGLKPVSYNIEIKSHRLGDHRYHPAPAIVARLVHDVIAKYGFRDRILIQSFDPRSLAEIHRMDASLKIGLLTMNKRSVKHNIRRLGFAPYAYNPSSKTCTKTLIRQAHDRNCKVIPWTVNSEKEMQKLKDKGVDGIITDYPDIALKLR